MTLSLNEISRRMVDMAMVIDEMSPEIVSEELLVLADEINELQGGITGTVCFMAEVLKRFEKGS